MRSRGKSDIVTVELCKASQGLCHKGLTVLVFHLSLSLQQPLPEVVEGLTDTGSNVGAMLCLRLINSFSEEEIWRFIHH